MGSRIAGFIHPRACTILRKYIVPVMNVDKISRIIKYDEIIILMGNKFCEKYTYNHQHDLIRSNLRLLGRLKYTIKQKFSAFYQLSYYDVVVIAV